MCAKKWMRPPVPALLLILESVPWGCQVRVGGKSEWVDVFMTTDADHSESVRCYMFLLQSRIFRDRTRGSIYQHLRCASQPLLTERCDGRFVQHVLKAGSLFP